MQARSVNKFVLALLCLSPVASHADDPKHEVLGPIGETGSFVFYAVPGISAHFFVHQWARRLEFDGKIEQRLLPDLGLDPHQGTPMLSELESETWQSAVDYYRKHFANERLVFSRRNNQLLDEIRDGRLMETAKVDGDLGMLRTVSTIYQKTWWPGHRSAILEYRDAMTPLIEKHGDCIAKGIRRAYGTWIPDGETMRVDLAYVTNWAGAYTTGDPVVLHIGVSDPQLQGTLGLELMYHESSHGKWVQPQIEALTHAAFEGHGQKPPSRFWHIVLFHTAGTLTQQCLVGYQDNSHQRYAEVVGLAARDGWHQAWSALDEHWRPYLTGSTDDRTAAMKAVAGAFVSATSSALPDH